MKPELIENGPKMKPRGAKWTQKTAKWSKMDQKWSQEEQKLEADRTRWPKTAPRQLFFATFGSQSHATINKSRSFLRVFAFLSDFGSKMCQDAPKMRQEGHKMSEVRHKLSQDRKLTNYYQIAGK